MGTRLRSGLSWYGRQVEWLLALVPGKWLAGAAIPILIVLAFVLPFIESKSDSLGWYGVALGVFGFWYTASQLYLTKRASEAAKEAAGEANRKAEETITKLATEADQAQRTLTAKAAADAYGRLIEWAMYFVEDAVSMEDAKQWAVATRRMRDAARQLREIQSARQHADARWSGFARSLDDFAGKLAHHGHDKKKRPPTFKITEWRELTQKLQDALHKEQTEPTAEESR